MSGSQPRARRSAPPPGQAPLPAPNAAALLRRNGADPTIADRPAVRFEDRVWTHGEYVAESARWANLFLDRLPKGQPPHVAVLLDNVPEYLFALGGAALSGSAIVGLNHTRRGEHLLRDIEHTHCGLVITEPKHRELLAPIADQLPPMLEIGSTLEPALAEYDTTDPGLEPSVDTIWALIFTSGTSDSPKAVICSQRRLMVTGNRMGMIMDLGPDDIGYVCMPLFHSNAVQVGWAPSIVYGASVGLARKFSASGWLPDVRHYGSTYFNYTGKPLGYLLAQPEKPDDADNPLRVAFGNEGSPQVVDEFARRFGVEVIDAYGATEGGVAVNRDAEERAGALGLVSGGSQGRRRRGRREAARSVRRGRPARRTRTSASARSSTPPVSARSRATTTTPTRPRRRPRFGWYWSGDLGYIDEDGYLFFAGRNADWIRVDGENFPAGPIEDALRQHPDVVLERGLRRA